MSVFGKIWGSVENFTKGIRVFLENTTEEMRKSNWPSRDQLVESTILVMITLAVIATFVAVVDFLLFHAIRWLGTL